MQALTPFIVITLLLTVSPASSQQSCAAWGTMIDSELLPAAGSPGLVSQMISGTEGFTQTGISETFNVRNVADATGSRLRPQRACPKRKEREAAPAEFTCEYAANDDSEALLDVEMRKGRITYLNPSRRFDPAGPANQVDDTATLAVAEAVAAAIGIPEAELHSERARLTAIRMVSASTNGAGPSTSRRIERIALIPRYVNGWPVFGSKLHVVVNNQGLPARFHAAWPDFTLGNIEAGQPTSRTAIIERVASELGELGTCDSVAGVSILVGWIEADVPDQRDEGNAEFTKGRYIPGIHVTLLPTKHAPGSGEVTSPIAEFVVPLVTGSAADA